MQSRGVPQSTFKWHILLFFCTLGSFLWVPVPEEHLMMVLFSSYRWCPKYQVVPENSGLPEISGNTRCLGYPLPDDFQNWIGSGRVLKEILGSGLGSGTRWALVTWHPIEMHNLIKFNADKWFFCVLENLWIEVSFHVWISLESSKLRGWGKYRWSRMKNPRPL